MWIILDIIIVAFIIVTALISAKKGFVRTIVEIVGFIAVILMANNVSPMLSNATYDKFIQPAIVNSIEEIQIEDQIGDSFANEISKEDFPEFVNKLLGNNFKIEDFTASVNENINKGVNEAVAQASQTVIKPIIAQILTLIYTLLIVVVAMVVVKFLAKFLNKLFSFSLVGKVNKTLGALLGMVKGIALAVIICSMITTAVSLTPNGIGFLNVTTLEATIIFKLLSFSI